MPDTGSTLTMDSMVPGLNDLSSNITFFKELIVEPEYSEVNSWFLMSHPWPVALITSVYLVFVLYLGPAIMKHRQPLTVRTPMLIYNLAMVLFSLWWIFKAVTKVQLSANLSCWTLSNNSAQERFNVNSLMWYYLMSKYIELLDTVFFVLRKKQNQVSFLHVYHHTNMAVFTWTFFKYVRSDQIMMIGIVNSAVHAVMYSYYFLAAFGFMTNNILKFKPFITWMQMGQFVFLIGYLTQLLVLGCDSSRRFTQFAVVNTFSFLLLFINFYHQTYSKRRIMTNEIKSKKGAKVN